MSQNLLENLNSEQLEAVMHTQGPLMIIAGAGTGKTTVITQRIAWLIEQGRAKPEEILALTFTEKAATEMEERIDQLLPIGYVDMWISTFHAFCERILREHALDIGIPHDFNLLDEIDTYLLIRKNIDKFSLDYYRPKSDPVRFIRALLAHFSRIKDEMISPEQYLSFTKDAQMNIDIDKSIACEGQEAQLQEITRVNELASAYHTYQQILLENNSLDFADLIFYTIELFQKRPKILQKYIKQFKYILVDEFQDTNTAQYELVKLLVNEQNNITVVGDDDQSIYKFRGASLSNILNFTQDFQNAKRIVLNQNYRSSNKVLDHAYSLIQHNNPNRLEHKEQINKQLLPNTGIDGKVEHIHVESLQDELSAVVSKIIELQKENNCRWSDFAILVRANSHAEPFIEIMDQLCMPYKFLALSGLYTKPVILDCLAWMRVIDLPYASPALYRILNHPALGISENDISKLALESKKKGLSLFEILDRTDGLSQNSKDRINELMQTLCELRVHAKQKPASELFVEIVKSTGILGFVAQMDDKNQIDENHYLQQFFERIKKFEYSNDDKTLKNFLIEFEHERSSGESGALGADSSDGPDVVQVMTVHASKGLEFRFVFLVNMVEQRFPSQRKADPIEVPDGLIKIKTSVDRDEHIEEERRLFYVAMTRAKEHLYLYSADDYGGLRKRKLSRFLEELNIEKTKHMSSNIVSNSIKPVINDAKYEYKLPKNISFTQITAFSNCPLQYKYAHILRIPVFGRYQMSFGKSMHNTLEQFTKEYIDFQSVEQVSMFENVKQCQTLPSLAKMIELYESSWIDEWYPDSQIREEYFKKGKDILNEYYRIIEKTNPHIAFLEKNFTLKISDASMKGRIDRIDKISDEYEIIDYKTGNPKDKLGWDEKKQLILYTMACEQCFDPGLKIKKCTYHYFENNSFISFEPTNKDKQKLIDEILESVEKIKNSDFNATPGFHCQFCDFKDICEQSAF